MPKPIELFECLTILKNNESVRFKDVDDTRREPDYRDRGGEIDYTFLSLELKSENPPTHLKIILEYTEKNKTSVLYHELHLMKLRKKFIFENGFYILYLEGLELFPENIRPLSIEMENKRDLNAVVNIFYRANFLRL